MKKPGKHILELLKVEDYNFFDFGRIPPSNHHTNGVYIFKNGIKGNKIQYCGEWIYYKNSIFEEAMYLYKKYFLKKQRY